MSEAISNQTKYVQKNRTSLVIMHRELAAYFSGPIAYIVTGLFLIFSGFLFFSTFFLSQRAELRGFFNILPVLFSFFIPALTMRLFAEEKRSGSIETLLTLPVTVAQVVAGKFMASLAAGAAMLVPTIIYVITASRFGPLDIGPVVGGYAGALLLCASYSAIGLFASAITKNQIIAFFGAFTICMMLSVLSMFLVVLPAPAVNAISWFLADTHFNSIARGIIDTRDILYFVSLTALFLGLAAKAWQNDRR